MGRNDNSGLFGAGNTAAAGTSDRGWDGRRLRKLYSEAVRELLAAPNGAVPEAWPKDRKAWSGAQELAERHFTMAIAGDLDTALHLIGRAEGKIPMAPEDREAGADLANKLLGGVPALLALQMALGLKKRDAIDTVVIETPALPEKTDDPS